MRIALRTAAFFCILLVAAIALHGVAHADDSNSTPAATTVAPAVATPASAAAATAPAKDEGTKTLWGYYKLGGFFMHPILLCSIVTVYLITDLILMTLRKRLVPPDAYAKLKELVAGKKLDEAIAYCDTVKSIFTRILGAGLRVYPRGKTAFEETLADYDIREASSMRVRVAYLNTIATISPMLGLLGTVSGIIKAFATLGSANTGASELAKNISEALIATYSGLCIAIPAMVLYFYFRNLVNDRMVVVQDAIGDMVALLEK